MRNFNKKLVKDVSIIMNLELKKFDMKKITFKPNENPLGTDHSSLRREWKNFYLFVKGGNDTLSPIRRESIFIQLLEGLHPDEAEIICLVKDKNLKKKYKLTRAIVEEAFPDIQWGNRS